MKYIFSASRKHYFLFIFFGFVCQNKNKLTRVDWVWTTKRLKWKYLIVFPKYFYPSLCSLSKMYFVTFFFVIFIREILSLRQNLTMEFHAFETLLFFLQMVSWRRIFFRIKKRYGKCCLINNESKPNTFYQFIII